jgi:hypothetical protein
MCYDRGVNRAGSDTLPPRRRLGATVLSLVLLAAQLLLPAAMALHERLEAHEHHDDPKHVHDASHCATCQTIASTHGRTTPPTASGLIVWLDLSPFLRPVATCDAPSLPILFDSARPRGPPTA